MDWSRINNGTVEEYWSQFKAILIQLEDSFIQLKSTLNSCFRKPVWMTNKASNSVKRKYKVFSRYKNKDHPAVKAANKAARKEIKKAKKNFEKKLATNIKHNSKSFYSYVRSKAKAKVQISSLKDESGNILSNDFDKATNFNTFFASVFTRENVHEEPKPDDFRILNGNKCTDILFDDEDVLKLLDKLRANKSPGPDELFPRLLLETKHEIAYPLFVLFRRSLDEAAIPTEWKRANVCPIFKKGNRNLAENYRPLSLTSRVCKVFEMLIIRDSLVKHLEDNSLIHDSQHGFRKGRSCLTNLLTFWIK